MGTLLLQPKRKLPQQNAMQDRQGQNKHIGPRSHAGQQGRGHATPEQGQGLTDCKLARSCGAYTRVSSMGCASGAKVDV